MSVRADAIKELSAAWEICLPPKRMTVAQAAQEYFHINQPGGYVGKWDAKETPYMVEPLNTLSSREFEAVCFVGPSRTGKTISIEAWMIHAVICDPGDMLVVQITQEKSREYSKTRIERALRHSPELNAMLTGNWRDSNTHDKMFKHGMMLKLGWPTVSQLSGSDFRYVALTDYDRMPEDIDGEGSAFDLGKKRTQTFLSRGMTYVDSSPGRDFLDPHWMPSTPHEAPPTSGILSIYNSSDRNRWYWPCIHQCDYFQATPGLELFKLLPSYDDLCEIIKTEDLKKFAKAHSDIVCPNCGGVIDQKHKYAMNQMGVWVSDGQSIVNGKIEGEPTRSNIAGYWLGGVSAAYQKWDSIMLGYLQGLREYVLTGSEETLKAKVNTDQGMPYMPRAIYESGGDYGVSNKIQEMERYVVPDEARLLLAAVDVQGGKLGRFVVQVHAIGVGLEQWLIDRFNIEYTDDGGRRLDPSSMAADWDVLFEKVINASYRTSDGRKMLVHLTAIDTGGEGDTTNMAYQFQRRCAANGWRTKVKLIKGSSNKRQDPLTASYGIADNKRKMIDAPFTLVDTSYFKDIIASLLRKREQSPPCLRFPRWLSKDFYEELQAEVKDEKGKWVKIRQRNESLDLTVYIMALCWHLKLNDEKFNWDKPWCAPLVSNSNVISVEAAREIRKPKETRQSENQGFKFSGGFGNSEWGKRL